MKTYPICLIGLEESVVVVVGGGEIATRKVLSLLEAGARVTVISPKLDQEMQDLAENGEISLLARCYQAGDLQSVFITTASRGEAPASAPGLVIAATDSPEVNHAVWLEACQLGCLVNVVDDPKHSNFILPAVVEYGELKISISTGGASPALARRLREKLSAIIGPEYGILAGLLAELRPELHARFGAGEPRLQAALQMVDSDALEIIRTQGNQAGRRYLTQLLERLEADQRKQRA